MGYEQIDPLEEYGSTPESIVLTKSASPVYAQYAAMVGGGKKITAATAATPIAITTAVGHGLTTDQRVIVGGVAGGSEANGTWIADVVDSTNFTLRGSVGSTPGTTDTGFVTAKWASTARVLDGILLNSLTSSLILAGGVPVSVYYGDYDPSVPDAPLSSFIIVNRVTSRVNRRNGIGRSNGLRFRSATGFILVADTSSGNWGALESVNLTALYREVM